LLQSTRRVIEDIHINGASMVLTKPGDLIYNKTSGYQSLKEDTPIDPNGVFWIASCTKLIASIAALQQVEKGLIDLDEPVSRILPELENPEIISLDPSSPDGFALRPATNKITLRQLITHTSGVGYEWMNPLLQKWRKTQPPVPAEKKGWISTTYNTPLLFEPGEGWIYGGGLDWAGEIVARLNKTTLADYLEEKVFKPLGIDSTTFHLDQRPELEARLVKPGRRQADGSIVPHEEYVFAHTVVDHSGGGGLWSTVPDYIKILGDLLKDEPLLLQAKTVEELMFKPQITNEKALKSLFFARTIAGANASPASAGMNYGLGGMLLEKDSDVLPVNSLSWGGLPNLKWFINRDLGVAGLYASQVLPPGDPKSTKLSADYFREVLRLAKAQQ
jgi:CubicO group peptidase (beta-lactamase class C family)